MALVLANRVQESATANTTVSFTLTGAISGFQSFAVIGDTNTTYYSATDTSGNWEVGLGTYSSTGPTLTRTTIYASSNGGSAVTFPGTLNVFVTYPSGKSVNLDGSGNVSALGTVSSGTWQGSTVGVAYGGTGVTASSGANSVMLRDANQNVAVNRLNQSNTDTSAAGGTTALTAASSYSQTLIGTGGQTYTMPDATTLTTGVAFVFNNNATGTLTLQDYATGSIGTITSGGAAELVLLANSTVAGTWDVHGFLPENVTWGTNALALGSTVITGGTWQGGTVQPAYGGTGLTTFTGANNALYSTGATTLTAGTLPVAAGGTGATTASGALTSLGAVDKAGDTMTGELTLAASTTGAASLNIPAGTAPTAPTAGDLWYDGTNIFFRVGANTRQIPFALTGGGGTSPLFTSITVSNTFAVQATTSNIDVGGLQTSGTWLAGGTSGTGTITLGRSTLSQTTNIQAGATASGSTKTINIGTNGLFASTTAITIGSLYGTSVTAHGAWTYTTPIPIASGGTGQTTANAAFNALAPSQTSNSGKYLTTDGTNTSWGTVSSPPSLSNDTSTASNLYPVFAASTTGTPSTLYTSNAQYLYKPSTGELSVKAPRGYNGVIVNSQTVTEAYTITSADNGLSAGPVTVTTGSITVSSGAVWTIV